MKRLLMSLILLIGGCEEAITDGPPQIDYGRAECARCGMIINDERHPAATIVTQDGKRQVLLFDDVGEQAKYDAEHPELAIQAQYVHDHATRQWLKSSEAQYLNIPDLQTPMGTGIVAVSPGKTDFQSKPMTRAELLASLRKPEEPR